MPIMANPHMIQTSVMNVNTMMTSLTTMEYVVTAMFPMIHAGLQVGREIESKALNLY